MRMAEAKRLHTPEGTPPSQRTLTTPHHSHQVLKSLHDLFRDGHLCDYTIIADGQEFKTHKNILASVSDYFRVMLTGPMIEARQDHVHLKGVPAGAIKALLDFAYTGKLGLNMDDIVEIISGASHLQMPGALELCSEFLLSEISRQTCVDVLNTAEMYALPDVKSAAIHYVVENFSKVAESDQFYRLHKDHLAVIFQSNQLLVCSELHLFHLLVKWVEFDSQERMTHVFDVLQHLRLILMKPEDLVDQVASSAIVCDDRCRQLVDEALQYHVLSNRQPLMQSQRTQIRNDRCMVFLGGRYGVNIGYRFNSNKMYALQNNKWHHVCNTESNYLYAAVCVVDNFLYVCGGMGKPAHARSSCHRYDPRNGTWTRLAHMHVRRQSFSLVALKNQLYALGGGTPIDNSVDHPPTEKCEAYSIEKNKWNVIAPFPGKRKSASACILDRRIYVSGGRTENETASTLWCYEEENDTCNWMHKSPMIAPHAGHAMVALDSKLYVIDRINLAVECYNPVCDEWSKVTAPLDIHSGIARPATMGPWVYFINYADEEKDYQCKRYNVLTLQSEELARYPDNVHCVIGIPLTLPQSVFRDDKNNNSSRS